MNKAQQLNAAPGRVKVSGFTFTEVLISTVLGVLVMAGLLSGYIQFRQVMERQRIVSSMQSNVRVALNYLSRDIGMAGYGLNVIATRLPDWITWVNNFRTNPAIAEASGVGNSDSITLAGAYTRVGGLMANAARGSSTLTIGPAGAGSKFNTTDKKLAYIGGCELVRITSVAGDTLTVSTHPTLARGLNYDHKVNEPVELVRVFTYSVIKTSDGAWGMPDCYLDRYDNTVENEYWYKRIVATGVEYMKLERTWPDAIRVILRCRSNVPDSSYTDPVYNDQYHRVTVTNVVNIRNLGTKGVL